MQSVCDDLRAHVADVLEEWLKLVAETKLPFAEHHDLDDLPEVVIGLVEGSVCAPHDLNAHREKVRAAVKHGERRRAQGFDDDVIYAEYGLLHEAIRRYLARSGLPRHKVTEALIRIDMAITLATIAGLRGFHRQQLEESGKFQETIDQLASESPLLDLPEPL